LTVTITSRRADYVGDGTTTEFSVPFQFYEISVYVDGTLQAAGSDYVVSQEEPGLEGSIIFQALNDATPPNDSDVVILGTTAVVQDTDYVNNDDFPAEVLEAALDRLTMIAQEQNTSFEGFVRSVQWHKPIAALDFAAHPETIIFVNEDGDVELQSAEQILGGIDIQDAIDSAIAAAASAVAADASEAAAAASAAAAAISAAAASSATGVLVGNPIFTGTPTFELGFKVGKNGAGDSIIQFYDDNSDAWRNLKWDDSDNDWQVHDAAGTFRTLWREGNQASQAEAEAGLDNVKGMTALRVAQAIAALAGEGAFPGGTIAFFGNTLAPPNWTKLVDLDNYAIRVVSGTIGTSGAFGYTTVFASRTPTGTVDGTTLDTTRIPAHGHVYADRGAGPAAAGNGILTAGASDFTRTTNNAGGGGSHDHPFTGTPMAFNVNTLDVIRAEKD
jgi:type II secretory pathway pseudopilin PulG